MWSYKYRGKTNEQILVLHQVGMNMSDNDCTRETANEILEIWWKVKNPEKLAITEKIEGVREQERQREKIVCERV